MQEMAPAWLVGRLLAWYGAHRRELPWRAAAGAAAAPYLVLLSELMLQQTTVATVSAQFAAFLARFPSFEALAAADEADVLHAWQGLGYYRRARALHACARAVLERHRTMPEDEAALRALAGDRAIYRERDPGDRVRRPGRAGRWQRPPAHGAPASDRGALARRRAAAAGPRRPPGRPPTARRRGAGADGPGRDGMPAAPSRLPGLPVVRGLPRPGRRRRRGVARHAQRRERPLRRGLAFLLARPDGAILPDAGRRPGSSAGCTSCRPAPGRRARSRSRARSVTRRRAPAGASIRPRSATASRISCWSSPSPRRASIPA